MKKITLYALCISAPHKFNSNKKHDLGRVHNISYTPWNGSILHTEIWYSCNISNYVEVSGHPNIYGVFWPPGPITSATHLIFTLYVHMYDAHIKIHLKHGDYWCWIPRSLSLSFMLIWSSNSRRKGQRDGSADGIQRAIQFTLFRQRLTTEAKAITIGCNS